MASTMSPLAWLSNSHAVSIGTPHWAITSSRSASFAAAVVAAAMLVGAGGTASADGSAGVDKGGGGVRVSVAAVVDVAWVEDIVVWRQRRTMD